ncbi:hypothetical protein RIB2604_03100890 [Aspergillus luchuensis]|uniref:Uncharacterized protein n=1 Tax=Aspergillus kawachii TaxID=1069201 RepID=A0A146FW63_ASPKA|nr:hypothetical protein RIB2604_03100890 [Aspergillus luchuensis]
MERSSGKLTPGADVTPSKHLAFHFPIGIWLPAPTCPPEELSSLSPDRLPFPTGLVSEDKVDELLLRDDGEAGTDEFGVVPCEDPAEPLNAAAAAAGLQ